MQKNVLETLAESKSRVREKAGLTKEKMKRNFHALINIKTKDKNNER